MSAETIVATYGNHRVEMNQEQLDKVLSILRNNNLPTTDEIRMLAYVSYQAVYWGSILSDLLKEYKKQHSEVFNTVFNPDFDPDIFRDFDKAHTDALHSDAKDNQP